MKSLFETKIEQKALKLNPKIHQELERTSRKLPEIDVEGVKWSKKNYPNGYTSYGSLSELYKQFSVFDHLKERLDREVKLYTKALGLVPDRGEIRLSALWVNLMPKHCYHAFHIHPNSVVSGTYYVSIPKKPSAFRIEDPRTGFFMATPPRKIQYDLVPKAGDMILFESWLKHEVPMHFTEETRISISFNYDWIQD